MDNLLELGYVWEDCPASWQNFVKDVWSRHPDSDYYSEKKKRKILKAELKKYNARVNTMEKLESDEELSVVIFATPEDKSWFLLKW